MILDALAELESGVAFDLEAVRPGPGKPVRLCYQDNGGTSPLVITMGLTDATQAVACIDVHYSAGQQVAFDLPTSVYQYILSTWAGTGKLFVVLDDQSNQ